MYVVCPVVELVPGAGGVGGAGNGGGGGDQVYNTVVLLGRHGELVGRCCVYL